MKGHKMEKLLDEAKKIFSSIEYKIFFMQIVGFKSDEIAKENSLSRTDLLEKWKNIKDKLMRRVVSKIK